MALLIPKSAALRRPSWTFRTPLQDIHIATSLPPTPLPLPPANHLPFMSPGEPQRPRVYRHTSKGSTQLHWMIYHWQTSKGPWPPLSSEIIDLDKALKSLVASSWYLLYIHDHCHGTIHSTTARSTVFHTRERPKCHLKPSASYIGPFGPCPGRWVMSFKKKRSSVPRPRERRKLEHLEFDGICIIS